MNTVLGLVVYVVGFVMSSWVSGKRRELGTWLMGTFVSFLLYRGKSQVALKIIRNVGKYREAARLEINVLKKIKEKDKENKL